MEVTRRICGSLDIDEALFDVFSYLKNELPLDAIFITIYEYEKKQAKVIAMAFDQGYFFIDEFFPLSYEAWEAIKSWLQKSKSGTVPWIRDHTHPINQEILKTISKGVVFNPIDVKEFCSITCALKIKKTIIGNLTFAAIGTGHYNESHARIIQEINEPFAIALSNALRYLDLKRENKALKNDERKLYSHEMIGTRTGLRKVTSLIESVADTDAPVLLLGETGTGKEVVANGIHSLSSRRNRPFVRLNCGAIPESLMDAELFGHEKGAFTGAYETSIGRFERADKGTLFLDEIGELPLNAQIKLLRVLQSGEYERIGGGKTLMADVRIIAATHRNLEDMIKAGKFRLDLWYRLNLFPVEIPPLRERMEDIKELVYYFINKKAMEMNLNIITKVDDEAWDKLMAYDWPGNVRELQNVIEREIILARGKPLRFDSFSCMRKDNRVSDERDIQKSSLFLNDIIADHISYALKFSGGKIAGKDGAAAILGIHPNTLRSKMAKLGIKYKKVDFF